MLKTKEEIIEWFESMGISSNKIVVYPDLTVDLLTTFIVTNKELDEIPIVFNKIEGDFYCGSNNLTKLPSCKEVKGEIDAQYNQISSLENFPLVHGDINLNYNQLTSLKGITKVEHNLYVSHNQLVSLEGCPEVIGIMGENDFDCSHNQLTSLKHSPSLISDYFDCSHNPLVSLEHCPPYIGGNFICKEVPFNILDEDMSHIKVGGKIKCDQKNDINGELQNFYINEDFMNESIKEIHISLKELKQYQLKKQIEANLNRKDNLPKPKI